MNEVGTNASNGTNGGHLLRSLGPADEDLGAAAAPGTTVAIVIGLGPVSVVIYRRHATASRHRHNNAECGRVRFELDWSDQRLELATKWEPLRFSKIKDCLGGGIFGWVSGFRECWVGGGIVGWMSCQGVCRRESGTSSTTSLTQSLLRPHSLSLFPP